MANIVMLIGGALVNALPLPAFPTCLRDYSKIALMMLKDRNMT